jgi:hypothetical protein
VPPRSIVCASSIVGTSQEATQPPGYSQPPPPGAVSVIAFGDPGCRGQRLSRESPTPRPPGIPLLGAPDLATRHPCPQCTGRGGSCVSHPAHDNASVRRSRAARGGAGRVVRDVTGVEGSGPASIPLLWQVTNPAESGFRQWQPSSRANRASATRPDAGIARYRTSADRAQRIECSPGIARVIWRARRK